MSLEFPTLPEPEIIDQTTFEAIFARKIALFRQLADDYTNIVEGDPVYMMAQVAAYDELNIRKQINNAYQQTLIRYATGANLDNLVANINLRRLVKADAVFDENNVLVSPEILETDDQLRQRYLLAWHAIAPGSFGWYKFHALNADAQVKDAFAKNTADGTVTVYIQSEDPNGGVPDATLLETVRAYLNALQRRTLCDTLIIEGITTVSYEIDATIAVPNELDQVSLQVTVQQAAEAFADATEIIGRDIPLSRFYAVLSPEGVAGVTLNEPTANVTTTDSEVPVARAVRIRLET